MPSHLQIEILPQPTDSTCGPTCLHAVYRYWNDAVPLETLIREVGELAEGGTLSVFLGCHALQRGYSAVLYSYNLNVFDPSWFIKPLVDIPAKLQEQKAAKESPKLRAATDAYLEFYSRGGEVRMDVLTIDLIRGYLERGIPLLTGLSATFLYGESRECIVDPPRDGLSSIPDDVRGEPMGHFVVLCGYDPQRRTVLVADPLDSNPIAADHFYAVDIDRVFAAIMLGVVTYDANLLIISPREQQEPGACPP